MLMSEFIKENNIPKKNEFNEFYTLTDEQFNLLEKAVKETFPTQRKTINYGMPFSYWLKYIFEKKLGFQISNYDIKLVMQKLGFKGGYIQKYILTNN